MQPFYWLGKHLITIPVLFPFIIQIENWKTFSHNTYLNADQPIRIGGLADVGSMCERSACAIVEDGYLASAFSIAHELGHM